MTVGVLNTPSSMKTAAPVRKAGGDNEVPRDAKDRPRIIVPCATCTVTPGKIPSPKTGKPIKCPKCGPDRHIDEIFVPAWHVLRSYTRTTTYIDVLDDKSNLQAWAERMVLVGVAHDNGLLKDVLSLDQEMTDPSRTDEQIKSARNVLNRKAQIAKTKAGADDKADKGTELHAFSELVDEGKPLPTGASFIDAMDMHAYRCATDTYKIVRMEQLVVHDELKVAGTPDRVSTLDIEVISRLFEEDRAGELFKIVDGKIFMIAPDGDLIGGDELLITDLKTGRVDYGGLKMAMQLALYSRSKPYDHKTGERLEAGNINQKWGVIMHLAAGSGECTLYWADLTLGWEAVQLAKLVRDIRRRGNYALSSF